MMSKPTYYAKDGWVHKRVGDRDLPVCRADQNQVVRAKMIAALMNQGELVPELVTALEALLKETELAGIADAKDYGWPTVVPQARAALAKAHEES